MQEWNVVVNINERGLKRAFDVLGEFGYLKKTNFFNVLLMNAVNVQQMLETLHGRSMEDPQYLSFLSRLIPVTATFIFQSPGEFEVKAKDIVLAYTPELAGRSFHVRMRRRGYKGRLSSLEEEKVLDTVLLESLEKSGTPGKITFEDPDTVIAVETVAQWAGISLWKREELQQYPFIKLN